MFFASKLVFLCVSSELYNTSMTASASGREPSTTVCLVFMGQCTAYWSAFSCYPLTTSVTQTPAKFGRKHETAKTEIKSTHDALDGHAIHRWRWKRGGEPALFTAAQVIPLYFQVVCPPSRGRGPKEANPYFYFYGTYPLDD